MTLITPREFLIKQPSFPQTQSTDPLYHGLSNHILKALVESGVLADYPESVVKSLALTVVGYYQDIISDAGLWRAFINENMRLYGRKLPFYDIPDDYVDYELNRVDVRWIVWYALCMNYEELRVRNPLDKPLEQAADIIYEILEKEYDEAPDPEGFNLQSELELRNPQHAREVLKLGNWLFLHSYLLTPAYALRLSEINASLTPNSPDYMSELQKALDDSMTEDPTGPLALYLREWLYMVAENKVLPTGKTQRYENKEHPAYTRFMAATGGKRIKFFDSYVELNKFFIEKLGWNDGEEHLPQLKNEHDYVLLVDKYRGMLLARNVARCIKCDDNPFYDKQYASAHAMDMLTVRGNCPCDLVKYACANGWLPDASFPGGDTRQLVADNYDFICRCYLQLYYRD